MTVGSGQSGQSNVMFTTIQKDAYCKPQTSWHKAFKSNPPLAAEAYKATTLHVNTLIQATLKKFTGRVTFWKLNLGGVIMGDEREQDEEERYDEEREEDESSENTSDNSFKPFEDEVDENKALKEVIQDLDQLEGFVKRLLRVIPELRDKPQPRVICK
ncbi:hypothetical protein SLS54_002137 [Diplodia seriata]